ncbi:ABC transporter substrate-binding protein [Actinomadura sp. SCN-SB]|uniref:ABC transporter substrate-binding protein n=1 Tax=Actinomadura sp. SCN-SB TaxID=3373092 RepID=UPI003753CC0D
MYPIKRAGSRDGRARRGGAGASGRGRRLPVVILTAALTVTAACGQSGSGAEGDDAPQVTLPTNKATGAPITIGLINNDSSPLGSFADIRRAVLAGASYVNDSLGGVGGRPIKIVPCTPNGSAPSSANCAAELLRAKPAAVLGGLDLGADGAVPALAKAGIPYVPSAPIGGVEFASPNSFSFGSGSPGSVSAGAAYAADTLKPKKVAVMFNENPQARLAAQNYVEKVMRAKGVTDISLVAYGNHETDLSGPLSQALKGGTDVVMGIMQGSGCANVMKAKQALGSTAKFVFPGSCADPQVLKAGGAGAEGAYFTTTLLIAEADHPDVKTFRAAMAKYDKSVPLSGFVQGGFATVVSLSRVMAKAQQPDSPKAVMEALGKVSGEQAFMGPKVTCDGKQLPPLRALCTKEARIAQYTGGALKDVGGRWVSS